MSSIERAAESSRIRSILERKSCDELRVVAKKLAISGFSRLDKSQLVNEIAAIGSEKINAILFPTWWGKYHNHVYGVASILGVVLTVAFLPWRSTGESKPALGEATGQSNRMVTSVETPIRFADFVDLPPSDRDVLLNRYRGKPTLWEGFLSETFGFDPDSLGGVPWDIAVGVRIAPTIKNIPQITAECQFGKLQPTDAGCQLAARLNLLFIGQRVQISGELAGDGDHPILRDAFLVAEWPFGE